MVQGIYEEIVEGVSYLRMSPGKRHELVLGRLTTWIDRTLSRFPNVPFRRLPPRSIISVTPGTMLRPDLALVSKKRAKLWLAIEVVNSADHSNDTVLKKDVYEQARIPRLWIADPRYDNVEIYRTGGYGLALAETLAGGEIVSDDELPGFQFPAQELFKDED